MKTKQVGDVHVLTLDKNLMGGPETDAFVADIEAQAAAGVPKIVLDLGEINYMNSTGIGSIVKAHTICQGHKGWLRVARVGARIKSLLVVTKLIMALDTYETVEEALSAPPKGPKGSGT